MPISLPDNIAHDVRQPILGDSFGWEGVEPAAAKKSIVIHATASKAPNEDGFVLADYAVNHNGHGGVDVHFICTEDGYPGKPQFGLPPGAQIQYVGDLLTWRAGTLNQNPGRIHIEISGLFTPGNGVPSESQLRAVRNLIDYLLAPNNLLPSLNYYSQVTYHNAVPGQNTACPGWQHPQFPEWFAYLQGGPEPSWWAVAPVEAPPAPLPEPPAPQAPEYEATYHDQPEQKTITRVGAHGVDVTTGAVVVPNIAVGTVIDVAGYFTYQGVTYARTVYSKTNNKWNGLDVTYFDAPTGNTDGEVPVNVIPPDPTAVATGVTDEQLNEATVPDTSKLTVFQLIKELVAQIVAKFITRKKK